MRKKMIRLRMSDEMDRFRKALEKEFFEMINRGDDIRAFLYFPYEILTESIKAYLDTFLMEEAYKSLMNGEKDGFEVYRDDMLRIILDEKKQRLELLNRLITHYESLEDYEKCARIKNILENEKENDRK